MHRLTDRVLVSTAHLLCDCVRYTRDR